MRKPKRAPVYRSNWIELPLTRGYVAIVDLTCPDRILQRSWYASKQMSSGVYALTNGASALTGKSSVVQLHRVLVGDRAKGLDIDHIDGDTLNNRTSNLRTCTRRQNLANIGARAGSSSRYRGVGWAKRRSKWVARLSWFKDGKGHGKNLGYFKTEESAARAWDTAALASGHYDPDFLKLNFPTV